MNDYFSNIVQNLEIKGYQDDKFSYNHNLNHLSNIISKYKDHLASLK